MYEVSLNMLIIVTLILFMLITLKIGLPMINSTRTIGYVTVAANSLNKISEVIGTSMSPIVDKRLNKTETSIPITLSAGQYYLVCNNTAFEFVYVSSKGSSDIVTIPVPLNAYESIGNNGNVITYVVIFNGVRLDNLCSGSNTLLLYSGDDKKTIAKITVQRNDDQHEILINLSFN